MAYRKAQQNTHSQWHLEGAEKNPRKFDGHLVRLQALLEFGWEGDNFLSDFTVPISPQLHSHQRAHVWFYPKPGRERQVYGAADIAKGIRGSGLQDRQPMRSSSRQVFVGDGAEFSEPRGSIQTKNKKGRSL
jgi:hypothetical protein